jgi:hypothetical protein
MAKPQPKKRELKFDSFDDMFTEIDSLLQNGYTANGKWNLSQALSHIADWARYPIDGFPKPPLIIRPMFWIMKITVGASMKRNILANGFSGGMPTAPESIPTADQHTDAVAAQTLRQTIDRMENHQGEFLPSPLFGRSDKKTLQAITLLHAAHHLGYLEPK